MEFCDRTEADFVTEYLNYDFQLKVNKEVKNEVIEVLKKICNSDDSDYDFIMNFYLIALQARPRNRSI